MEDSVAKSFSLVQTQQGMGMDIKTEVVIRFKNVDTITVTSDGYVRVHYRHEERPNYSHSSINIGIEQRDALREAFERYIAHYD
jgi:hypothetical protein